MFEKYNLKKMLDEIKEDESLRSDTKDVKASQDEIKKMLAEKKKGKKQ